MRKSFKLSRRGFIAGSTAAVAIPARLTATKGSKRVLTLVYDKALGSLRAIDKLVR